MTEPKANTVQSASDLSKDEMNLLRTLKELGVPPSRLTKLLSPKQETPHSEVQSQDGVQTLLQFLKERPRDEKLTVSDLTMLILASNLGGGTNKGDNAISVKDLLPLLSKRELTIADVMAILDKTRPPPAPAAMP